MAAVDTKKFRLEPSQKSAINESLELEEKYAGKLSINPIYIDSIVLNPKNARKSCVTIEECINSSLDLKILGISKDDPNYKGKKECLERLQPLAKSIKKNGLINPIKVYKTTNDKFLLEAGERRTLASALAGEKIILGIISNYTPNDYTLGSIQFAENLNREDLSLSEKLECIRLTIKGYCFEKGVKEKSITRELFSEIFPIKRTTAYNYYTLWACKDEKIIDAVEKEKITSLRSVITVINEKNPEKRRILFENALEGKTLSELNKGSLINVKKSKKIRAGRKRLNISFGSTKKSKAAKMIFDSIIQGLNLQSESYQNIDWSDLEEITAKFKCLVNHVEEISEEGDSR